MTIATQPPAGSAPDRPTAAAARVLPRKIPLAHLPTPLWRSDALDELVGAEVWVKRDDMTAGAEAGNKIRKLEYLLAVARDEGATDVITCGGAQSNHARATALLAAGLGLKTVLLLRTPDPRHPPPLEGNLLLDRLAGAEVRFITPAEYADRADLMEQVREDLFAAGRRGYVIPEGGSSPVGALGYVDAMQEVREQLDLHLGGGPTPFDAVVHACGSGGTAAGVALGARRFDCAPVVHALAVCDDIAYFERVIGQLVDGARSLLPEAAEPAPVVVHDAFKGPAYGVASPEQRRFIAEVARRTGLVVDPVYSGKALFGLAHMDPRPRRVLFLHTGGLPGLLAQHQTLASILD